MVLAICAVLVVMIGISAATHNEQSGFISPTTSDNIDFITGDTIKDAKIIQLDFDLKTKAPAGGAVLWDLTHGIHSAYDPSGEFSSLVSLLSGKGYTVNTADAGILNIDLNQYGVLVICLGSAWNSAYTTDEVAAINSFVQNGGGLLVMGENPNCPNENINPVAQAFGTKCGLSDLSYLNVTDLTPHPIFDGVSDFFMVAAGEVRGVPPSEEVARTDSKGTITVTTLGSGRVVVTGDFNFFENDYISYADNQLLAENIFDWLHNAEVTKFLIIDHDKDKTYFACYDYDTTSESDFSILTVSEMKQYDVIYFEPDWSDYSSLKNNMANLQEYVDAGGVVVINIAGTIGSMTDIDPAGTDYDRGDVHSVETINDPHHAYITGKPYGGTQLTESDFSDWYWSDVGFVYDYPDNAEAVLSNVDGTTWIHYTYGSGDVVTTTLTYGWGSKGAKEAPLDNLIKYAVNIQEDGITITKVIPTSLDSWGYYPELTSCEAENRAESLLNFVREQGKDLDYSQMPTLKHSLLLSEFDDEALEIFAAGFEYANITIREQIIGVCAHRTDFCLILELDGMVVFDTDGNGQLGESDGIFFSHNDWHLWFPTTKDDRAEYPEIEEFTDWLYPNVVLGTGEGFGIDPDIELTGFLDDLWDVAKGCKDFCMHMIYTEKELKNQWYHYPAFLQYRGIPTEIVKRTYGEILLRQSEGPDLAYSSTNDAIYLRGSFLKKGKLSRDLTNQQSSQVYHEFVHAYWDRVAEDANEITEEGHVMYLLIHGIADELKNKELKIGNIGRKKLKLTENEALNYAEEVVAYAAQALCKFHYDFYKNEKYFTKKGKITKKGQKEFETRIRREVEYGYFKRGSNYNTLYDTVPTDYSINKALEAIGSNLRISGEEAKATYTKKKVKNV